MTVLAGFIGVNRYQDSRIRDLGGAARDATALWALFSDSLADMQATRLVDNQATLAGVRGLFAGTLDKAGPDDVVILSFAGHGTRDHRLVLADTSCDDLPNTTIPMAELADRFRASRARAVFCILDCCFSGNAPARVLEDSVPLRDIADPLAAITGNGRVLIAASSASEPALEDPATRHGLFTKALAECLEAAAAPVSFIGVADQVMKQVRAAAARLGYAQTPALFGHVEGEVAFPAIRRGAKFAAAFPELTVAAITPQFQELAKFGLGQQVIDLWAAKFPDGLNALQLAAINDHGVLAGRSLLAVAPTSAGKTFIGELAAVRAIQQGEKAVFLLPYKALVNEKFDEFSELYGARLGLRVARCSGDWQDQIGAIRRGKYDIAFFTYETFLGLSVASPYLLGQVGLVVLDEAQFITDEKRGIVVELALTNLINARRRGIRPQIVALSAVIGNTNSFERWLDCGLLKTAQRPVPLIEGVMDRSGAYQIRDQTGAAKTEQLLPPHAIRVRKDKPGSQDMIVPLVRKLVGDGEKVIVFRNIRGSSAGCAAYLAAELGLPPAQDAIDALPVLDQSTTSQDLAKCLKGGTAFHSSNLSREERGIVENAFRDPKGPLKVLVATSTVAAGVNTPASTVIIVEHEFIGGEGRRAPYAVATYKNMAGRAGRLGYERQGKAILLAETPAQRDQLFRRYVQGAAEPIASSFNPESSATWLIRLLAQVEKVTRAQALELVANTYGGFLANLGEPGWQKRFEGEVARLIRRMEEAGLIETDGPEHIRLSILGNACGQSPLQFESALQLVEMLRQVRPSEMTPAVLMALIQALPEQDDDYTPVARGRADSVRPGEVAAWLGHEVSHALQRRAGNDITWYARCKRALILMDWIGGVRVEEIESRYSPNPFSRVGPGDIRGYADLTRFNLSSASRIAAIVHAGAGPTEEQISALLKQLDLGLPQDALALTDIPLPMGRGEYLALYQAGARTPEQARALARERLAELLGKLRAAALAAALGPPPPQSLVA